MKGVKDMKDFWRKETFARARTNVAMPRKRFTCFTRFTGGLRRLPLDPEPGTDHCPTRRLETHSSETLRNIRALAASGSLSARVLASPSGTRFRGCDRGVITPRDDSTPNGCVTRLRSTRGNA